MKASINDVSAHISGNHPTRELTTEDIAERADEAIFWVGWQQGFEVYSIAVYGNGLCQADACESAEEYTGLSYATYCQRIR
jgi:hypothetical protein